MTIGFKALETSRAISPMKVKSNFLQSYLYYRHSKEKTAEGPRMKLRIWLTGPGGQKISYNTITMLFENGTSTHTFV